MSKRLTDAECAAEMWRADADAMAIAESNGGLIDCEGWSVNQITALSRVHTLYRFAANPHAHEEP